MRYSTHTWTAVFATLLVVTATAPAASAQTTGAAALRVGAARVDVTPSQGELPKNSRGILDRLYARAIVLEKRHLQRSAHHGGCRSDTDGALAGGDGANRKGAGNSHANVLLTATHTHSAGGQRGPGLRAEDRRIGSPGEAAPDAGARVGYGTGESHINVNRQIIDPKTNRWWEGPNREGPSDKTVAVLKFETLAARPSPSTTTTPCTR